MRGSWEAGNTSSPSRAVGVGRQGKHCQAELVPGRGGCQTAVGAGSDPGRELTGETRSLLALRALE